jgi:hypothetical protein
VPFSAFLGPKLISALKGRDCAGNAPALSFLLQGFILGFLEWMLVLYT